jgi:hypothetical protein
LSRIADHPSNVDYLALRGQLTTMDELLRTSGVENEFVMHSLNHWIKTLSQSEVEQIELSGEGQSGVIRLEDLVSGKQQARFQEQSVRALRCSIARTLLVGSFRDFAARLADSPLLQWFCQVAQLDRVKVPAKSTLQRYATWLPEEEMREVINVLLCKAGAAMAAGKPDVVSGPDDKSPGYFVPLVRLEEKYGKKLSVSEGNAPSSSSGKAHVAIGPWRPGAAIAIVWLPPATPPNRQSLCTD